jgi:hypothetical protein
MLKRYLSPLIKLCKSKNIILFPCKTSPIKHSNPNNLFLLLSFGCYIALMPRTYNFDENLQILNLLPPLMISVCLFRSKNAAAITAISFTVGIITIFYKFFISLFAFIFNNSLVISYRYLQNTNISIYRKSNNGY